MHWGQDRRGAPFDLAGALTRIDSDVVALQEVWTDNRGFGGLSAIAQRAGYLVHEAVMSPRADLDGRRLDVTQATIPGRWGSAILLREPCLATSMAVLGRAPLDAERWVHMATIALGERPVHIANTHLTHRFPLSVLQLRRAAAHLRRSGGPGMLIGDMNMPPPLSRLVTGLDHGLRMPTWPSGWPFLQPDQVLLTPGWVVDEVSVLTGLGSDHDAIRLALRLDLNRGQDAAQQGWSLGSGSSGTVRPSESNNPTADRAERRPVVDRDGGVVGP